MKNIAFFSGDITNSGGTERVSTIIASELSKKSEYNIIFISITEKRSIPFFEINEKIKRFVLYEKTIKGSRHIFSICRKLKNIIKNNNIDVIIDIDGILDLYSLIVKLFTKVKVISWEHFNFYQNPVVPYRKYTRALAGKYADRIVTLTDEDLRYYKENLKIKCPIVSIPNPVLNINKDILYSNNKILLSVGRLTYQKGFDMLLDVAKIGLEKHSDWKWIILGEGEERKKLEEKIQKLNLENKVILKGNVDNICDYYKKAGIFVLTSRYEGLPMTLLESKSFKLPVVSFDIKTGPKDCVRENINGFLIENLNIKKMAEKLSFLMANDEIRKEFSRRALEHTEKFKLNNVLNRWNNLLNSL